MVNFSKLQRKFCLLYSRNNSLLFANATKIYQIKTNDSEIKIYPLFVGNISKNFTSINMKKTRLNGYVYEFFVDFNIIDTSNTIDIHKYLMKKHDIE